MTALTDPIFHSEAAARAHMERICWPDGPVCRHCGNADQAKIKELAGKSHRAGLFQCNECREHFTVTVGTVMERSHIPLHKWVLAYHLMNASKKGISAHQMHRMLKITYKSAWFMCHRIRESMRDVAPPKLGGKGKSVQADETYYGNSSKRAKSYRKGHRYKQQIVCLVEPGGKARAFHIPSTTSEKVHEILLKNADRGSELHTDESRLYLKVGQEFADHKTVEHGWNQRGIYVGKDGQTVNAVENFFGTFKRGMVGTYQKCGAQHLQRYVTEFEFRFNNRSGLGVSDTKRTALAIKGAEGKRLTYQQPDNYEDRAEDRLV